LTHGHFDHQGCSHAICDEFGIPLMCGEGDREALESGNLSLLMPRPDSMLGRFSKMFAGPGHPVSQTLSEADEVGGLSVIETPGHTPGHLSYWHEKDRVLIVGDVLFHRNPVTLRKGLAEPFRSATFDRTANLKSARKLAALEPRVVCFGHGAPLHDGEAFVRFVEELPDA
jgi:glyoxylase-like metal-dependent hydrolase (beta-lactamase superfamily II)